MNVYKYRSNNKKHLETAMNNQIFAALPTTLNDTFEIKFNDTQITHIINLHENMKNPYEVIKQKLEKIGVYSLSKNHLSIKLWSEYANESKGFCIEYDLDLLLSFIPTNSLVYHSAITYEPTDKLPELTHDDLNNQNLFYKKTMLTKYIEYQYENEYRLVLNKSALKDVHPQAIRAIYFGEKMAKKSSETKEEEISQECVMNSLKGRNIKYFQVASKKNQYKLDAIEIEDLYKDSQKIVFKKNEIDKKVIDSNSFIDMNIMWFR